MNINVNGINTNYLVAGSGDENVLILPGWGATSAVYNLIVKQLAEKYTVYVLDLPGFGITAEPSVAWAIDDYADFVTAFIKECGLEKVILMGHSYGGRIIINLCNRTNAFEITKVVLVDSAGIKAQLSSEQLKRQAKFKKLKKIFQSKPMSVLFPNAIVKLQNKFGSSDYASASPIMKQTLVKAVSQDYTDIIPNITAPTLLIWGENDTATPISDAETMNSLIKGSTLEVIADAGHFPFVDQPFEFIKILKAHFNLSN